jgi:NodT family efflux transporter outer membrane factor (OMF) lipoprotein
MRVAPAWGRRLGAGLLLLGLFACAGPAQPPGAVPLAVAVPAAWRDAQGVPTAPPAALVQWWLRFGDPLLTSLIEQALAANTSVQSAQAAVRGARAQRDVAAAALWPGLNATASVQRNNGNSGSSNSASAGLDASWELDLFGTNRSALEAGNATLRASAASLGDVQVSLAAEVAVSYITLRGAQARLGIAQSNLDSQQDTLQITAWRQQAGLVTAIDLEQARGAVAQTSAQLPALRTTIEQARHALAVLTGQAPDALAQALAAAQPVPRAPDELALAIPADTLRQRPDVRAAEQQAMAAAHKLSAADAALLPSFRLGGSLGLNAVAGNTSVVSALLASLSYAVY